MLESGDSPAKIVEDKGLKQTSDTGAIEKVIADVLAANAEKVEQYRGGKEALFGFFVGQTMKAMGGKATPKVVNELDRKSGVQGKSVSVRVDLGGRRIIKKKKKTKK